MYNPKNLNFCHWVCRTRNPCLRLHTHNCFLEFCISNFKIQKPWLLLLIFHIANPRRSHSLDTLYTVMHFKIYNTKNSNYCHWNFFRRNPRAPQPSRYSLSLVFSIWTFTIQKIQIIAIKIFTSQTLGYAYPLRTLCLKFRISIWTMQKTRVIAIKNFTVQILGHRCSFATLSLVF